MSSKMKKFTESLGILHVFLSPENPRSNDQAESSVKKVKNLVKRKNVTVKHLSSRLALSLSQLNNMATVNNQFSPAEAFFGHTMRTLTIPLLEHKMVDRSETAVIRQEKHDKRKEKSSMKRKPTLHPLR